MTDTKRTPGPWRYHNVKYGRYSDCHYIVADAYSTATVIDGRDQIATCHGYGDPAAANAAFIVEAANNYDRLVAERDQLVKALQSVYRSGENAARLRRDKYADVMIAGSAWDDVRAALKNAGVEI